MSAKELAFTIAGLIATFFMPWPGAWNASEDPVAGCVAADPHGRAPVRSSGA